MATVGARCQGVPVAFRFGMGHDALVERPHDRPAVALVAAMMGSLAVVVSMVSFGVNTACTNSWSCTSSDCAPCRVVSLAAVAGLLLGGSASAGALFSPWPKRGRTTVYVAAMVATVVLVIVLAQTWRRPGS